MMGVDSSCFCYDSGPLEWRVWMLFLSFEAEAVVRKLVEEGEGLP